mmetsp:Transcript_33167/g.53943  ORF Transcript_33167/g.53943 Transcript_33167/m.53943 type:complete len:295 (+) Transcript_33167:29-913(+)
MTSLQNVHAVMSSIHDKSLPKHLLLIKGYIRNRLCVEDKKGRSTQAHELTISKRIVHFILHGLYTYALSTSVLVAPLLTVSEATAKREAAISPVKKVVAAVSPVKKVVRAISVNEVISSRIAINDHDDDKATLTMMMTAQSVGSQALILDIARTLVKVCETNRAVKFDTDVNIPFKCGPDIPSISIYEYLKRFATHSRLSEDVYIMALIYMDRVIRQKSAVINLYTVHRYLLAALLAAAKFHEDKHYNNRTFARLGGVGVAEVNRLEIHFLNALQFNLFIAPHEYQSYSDRILI